MNKIKHEYKLSQTLIISAVFAFCVSALVFVFLQYASRDIIHDYCNRPDVTSIHIEKKIANLQQYIEEHRISLEEVSKINDWMRGEDLTEIIIYHDNILLYRSNTLSPDFSFPSQPGFPDFYLWHNKYVLTFQDKTAEVFIKDFFKHRYIDYATYFNLMVFFICFISIMGFFIRKNVSYINALEQEIRILEGGELNYSITIKGNDELASLAQEIDEMRKAFIEREEYAQRVRMAANELMTSISHDLRTPLTVLIGYLEVLENEEIPLKDSQYIVKSKERALQLKGLINNLFEHFFVSENGNEKLQLSSYIATKSLAEITKEHIDLLEQSGFTVINQILLPKDMMRVNEEMLQRIFDNLLSNIQRYADPAYNIVLKSAVKQHELVFFIQNNVLFKAQEQERTGLGLKNCEKMMLLHQGRFLYKRV